jgi:Leucine-rich repeat (LRR) protein
VRLPQSALKPITGVSISTTDVIWVQFPRLVRGACADVLLQTCSGRLAVTSSGFAPCLAALQTLHLSWCKQLMALPESFGQLAALLNLRGCKQLMALPESFGRLAALQTLDLGGCKQLMALPESFGHLAALQTLQLSWCEQLTALHESFGQLAALQILDLRGCSALRELPGLMNLTALVKLDIRECVSLEAIPSLTHLSELQVNMDDIHRLASGNRCVSVSNVKQPQHTGHVYVSSVMWYGGMCVVVCLTLRTAK